MGLWHLGCATMGIDHHGLSPSGPPMNLFTDSPLFNLGKYDGFINLDFINITQGLSHSFTGVVMLGAVNVGLSPDPASV